MKFITAEELAKAAPYRDIIEALRAAFQSDVTAPVRHHHEIDKTTLLLMPAWSKDWTGLKTVTVKPDNAALGLSVVQANYLLIDNKTGTPVVAMDGTELTRRRTAAASALAADYLARPDASTLAIFGAGALAPHFLHAHASVRPIQKVLLVNRSASKFAGVQKIMESLGFEAEVTTAERAAAEADIISCVTSSDVPLLKGAWLKPGTHIDLAGAYKPTMRETDADVIVRSEVYVDTYEGCKAEAGDLIQAMNEGKFSFDAVKADLAELCTGKVRGRASSKTITLFKSVGSALEDLATATMVHLRLA